MRLNVSNERPYDIRQASLFRSREVLIIVLMDNANRRRHIFLAIQQRSFALVDRSSFDFRFHRSHQMLFQIEFREFQSQTLGHQQLPSKHYLNIYIRFTVFNECYNTRVIMIFALLVWGVYFNFFFLTSLYGNGHIKTYETYIFASARRHRLRNRYSKLF